MTGRKLLFQGILTSLIALYGCGGGGGGSTPAGGGGPTLVSITITLPSTIAKGLVTQCSATGYYSNGTSSNVTASAVWTSLTPSVATIDPTTGVATAVAPGTTTITADLSGKTASVVLTVTDAELISLSIAPLNDSIPKGLTKQFTATGTFTDSSVQDLTLSASWTSSDTAAATISTPGLAVSVATGITTITADLSGKSSSATLTVTDAVVASLSTAPSNTSVPKGWPRQFTVTGTYTDSTTQDLTSFVDWGSSNTSVATISAGLASSLNVGSTTISAIHSGKTATALLTVTPAEPVSLLILPSFAIIANGKTQQYSATATLTDFNTPDVTASAAWDSSDPTVATISAAGLATSVATGTTTISATYSGLTATSPLTITTATLIALSTSPSSTSIAKGLTQQFTATGHFSDNSTLDVTLSAAWSSSDSAVSTISATGLASSKSQGSSIISAVYSGQTATALLTVTPAVPARIDVTPINPIRRPNATQQFTAIEVFTDNTSQDMTNQVNWASTDSGIATITTGGLASPVSRGTTTISATDSDSGLIGTTLLLVRDAVTLPDTGQTGDYTATFGEDSDYTINDPSYMDNNDGTITDLYTGLVWQQDGGTIKTWIDSYNYCQTLDLAGASWRLPTRRELTTILDLGVSSPKINENFRNTNAAPYWTSEFFGLSQSLAVDFGNGYLIPTLLVNPSPVRCVIRGMQLSDSSFQDNLDGTVFDSSTGLMWHKCSAGQNALDCSGTAGKAQWENAITYCEALSIGGHADWRLPNAKELESLIYGTASPTVHDIFKQFTMSDFYWTSTTCSHSTGGSYIINFTDKTSQCNVKTSTNTYVRCVRGGL